ncbi:MAG: hypothetical protein ACE5FU_07610, partial [Nitrospinota bacterium]
GFLIISVAALKIMRGEHDAVVHTRKRYSMKELSKTVEESGFQVVQKSYRLFFLSVPILLIRTFGNLFKKKKVPSSDLQPLPAKINGLLILLQKVENRLLDFIRFPFGASLFFVLKKR